MSRNSSPAVHQTAMTDESVNSLLLSTWHMLHQQVPPPSLREILGAYNQKGNGDREMLLAMLNAKSAEDQRLASLVTLYQTLLQAQYPAHQSPPAVRASHPGLLLSPPHSFAAPPSPTSISQASGSRSSSSMSPHTRGDTLTLPPLHHHLSQKRRRTDSGSGESTYSSQLPGSHMRYQPATYSDAPSPSEGSVRSEGRSSSRKGSTGRV